MFWYLIPCGEVLCSAIQIIRNITPTTVKASDVLVLSSPLVLACFFSPLRCSTIANFALFSCIRCHPYTGTLCLPFLLVPKIFKGYFGWVGGQGDDFVVGG